MVDLSGSWLKVEDFDLVREVHLSVVREWGRRALQYTDPAGAPEAREALEGLLGRVGLGGLRALFTTSLSDSLRVLKFVHLDDSDCVSLEDPTSREALSVFRNVCSGSKLRYVQPIWRDPDGRVYSAEELAAEAGAAPLVVYDLTYGLLADGEVAAADNVVVVGSLHALFPGLHLGFIAAPEELYKLYLGFVEGAYLHPPTYMQYLFYAAVKNGAVYRIFRELQRRREVVRGFAESSSPYFAWVRAKRLETFLKHGAVRGSEFSSNGRFGEYARLGLLSATAEELEEFVSKILSKELQSAGAGGVV
ncbi:MAG: aminotransferase [Pyrobaculum sp.]